MDAATADFPGRCRHYAHVVGGTALRHPGISAHCTCQGLPDGAWQVYGVSGLGGGGSVFNPAPAANRQFARPAGLGSGVRGISCRPISGGGLCGDWIVHQRPLGESDCQPDPDGNCRWLLLSARHRCADRTVWQLGFGIS